MTTTTTPEKARPRATTRVGAIQAAIWANEHEGRTLYNVTVERIYRDQNGDWKSTTSFGRDDLLTLAKAADRAHSLILDLQAQDREASAKAAEQQQQAQSGGR